MIPEFSKLDPDICNECPLCKSKSLYSDKKRAPQDETTFEYGCNNCKYMIGANYHGFFFNEDKFEDIKEAFCMVKYDHINMKSIAIFTNNDKTHTLTDIDVPFTFECFYKMYLKVIKVDIIR